MIRIRKKRIISAITTLAIVFSLGTASTLEAYEYEDDGETIVKLEYEHIEELADGGKLYIYNIDGVEHKFPVPPEGFNPLTATDEQLETYGFPPRPDEENIEDYEYWVEIMSSYKSTLVPEIEQITENNEPEDIEPEDTESYSLSNYFLSQRIGGYTASLQNTNNFFTQIQGDFEQPTIKSTSGTCINTFMVGFGNPGYTLTDATPSVSAGTRCVGKGTAYAYYECLGGGKIANQTKILSNLVVNPNDKVHVYIAYQKSNNAFNYYIVNMTTGKQISDVITFTHSFFYSGEFANWYAGRESISSGSWYGLGNFGTVKFTNCQAMVNNSTTWTSVGDLTSKKTLMGIDEAAPVIVDVSSLANKKEFTITWLAYQVA